jgi:hypothetical protein
MWDGGILKGKKDIFNMCHQIHILTNLLNPNVNRKANLDGNDLYMKKLYKLEQNLTH